jgi:hypothetical protein
MLWPVLPAGFQRIHAEVGGQCKLCRVLLEHKISPKKFTMCYANSTWQQAADSAVAKVKAGIEVLPSLANDSSPAPAR